MTRDSSSIEIIVQWLSRDLHSIIFYIRKGKKPLQHPVLGSIVLGTALEALPSDVGQHLSLLCMNTCELAVFFELEISKSY